MNINRDLVYENGKIIATTTKVEEMDKTLLFRLLESCAMNQRMILEDVARLRDKYEDLKKEETELKEALAVIEEAEAKKAVTEIGDAFDTFGE